MIPDADIDYQYLSDFKVSFYNIKCTKFFKNYKKAL